jgi:hypothetical protein
MAAAGRPRPDADRLPILVRQRLLGWSWNVFEFIASMCRPRWRA